MSKNRPTVGVLAGWQVYEGAAHGFFDPVLRGIQAAAASQSPGCDLLLACGMSYVTSEDIVIPAHPAWPVFSPESDFVPVGPWNTDGLLVITPLMTEARSRYIQELIEAGHPVVFIGSGETGPAVVPDNAGGIRQALAHLKEHGHARVAYIAGGQEAHDDSSDRLKAYQALIHAYGLVDDPALIAYGFHNTGAGQQAMQRILASGAPFTAVLASNDESAIGAMTALREAGLRVPQEIAVIGFDDRLEASAQRPPLTSVHYPAFEAGSQALEALVNSIQGRRASPEIIRIPTRLVIRHSCGCLPPAVISASLQRSMPSLADIAPAEVKPALAQSMTKAVMEEAHFLSPEEVQVFCQSLVEACVFSLEQHQPMNFWQTLQDLLWRVEAAGDDPHTWQAAISTLEHGACWLWPAGQAQESESAATEMFRQARLVISESVRHQHRRYITQQDVIADRLGMLNARLLAASDERQIFKRLAEYLPAFEGIHAAQAAFFEPEEDDPVAWSVLPSLSPAGEAWEGSLKRFPSRTFPPEWLRPTQSPFTLVVLPLIVREGIFGFVAFDVGDLGLMNVCAAIVRQLAAALKSAWLYRLKNRFLSTVSHELRTPLNLIVGLSEVLLRDQAQAAAAEQFRADVEHIHASAQHLSGLIRDVLDLAGSEAGQLKLAREPLDLRHVLDVVVKTGEQLARDKGLTWRSDIPDTLPRVWGDRTRLRQVALNLVSNAIKFTEKGTITLEVKRMRDEGGRMKEEEKQNENFILPNSSFILVSVSDTGLGIPPEEQRAIFDEFRQSERTTARGYGGLGLGLAICKRLIELHGGEIGVRSSGVDGNGSTFYFTLPVMDRPVSWQELLEPLARPQTVLVLTESASGGDQLQAHLKRQGFEVEVRPLEEDGAWLPHVVELSPGAVILELDTASERGWDILKVLKEHPGTRDLPVLFYSLTQEQDSGAVLEMDYLMKPMQADDLTRALARQGLEIGGETEKKNILIVDDEPGILDMHARMVQTQAAHYRVLKAKNGREALSVLEHERVDLVLLDLMMPELDGFSVLERMRTQAGMREVPVVVLTAQVLSEGDMARLNRGVVTVLRKGVFNAAETLKHVEAALERNRKLGSEAQRLVRKGMAYVHEHYAEGITREALARYVGASEDYLTRCFRQELGVTPMTYLNRYRVSRAKELLATGRRSVTEVAMAVGFSDSSYFGRVFRREAGMSPGVWLKNLNLKGNSVF